jgi:hypothetical protein
MATSESDAIMKGYTDKRLQQLHQENEALLRELYLRFTKANVNIYKEGIGLSMLTDQKNEKLHYIMVNVRPGEIKFDETATKPEQRFSKVLGTYVQKYFGYMKKSDIDRPDIEGLAFGVYWPVLDFSQCDTYGGFIEYINIYFPKQDVYDLLDGKETFQQAVQNSEVVTSLNLGKPTSVRPVF